MTTHAVERERFQVAMEAEGMPRAVSAKILRHAQTWAREIRQRSVSATITSFDIEARGGRWSKPARAERLIREWCNKATRSWIIGRDEIEAGFLPIFQGDSRGACVKIRVPSGRTDDHAREGICVPTR